MINKVGFLFKGVSVAFSCKDLLLALTCSLSFVGEESLKEMTSKMA